MIKQAHCVELPIPKIPKLHRNNQTKTTKVEN